MTNKSMGQWQTKGDDELSNGKQKTRAIANKGQSRTKTMTNKNTGNDKQGQ
jgi:hypothetical protein